MGAYREDCNQPAGKCRVAVFQITGFDDSFGFVPTPVLPVARVLDEKNGIRLVFIAPLSTPVPKKWIESGEIDTSLCESVEENKNCDYRTEDS